jgi:hypothetical protein
VRKRDYRCREELTGPIDKTEVVIAPPSIYLIPASETVRGNIKIAAQNCYFKETGAFTGEIRCAMLFLPFLQSNYFCSPKQLVDAKIPYVILGTQYHLISDLFLTSYRPLGAPNTLPRGLSSRCDKDSCCDRCRA